MKRLNGIEEMVYISLIILNTVWFLKVGQQFSNSHLDKIVVVVTLPEKQLGMGSQVISNVPELFLHLRKKLFKFRMDI